MQASSSLSLPGALDPTYTLSPNRAGPAHGNFPAYLRLYYLLLGSFVIPRTYLIHGVRNPFFELYKSGERGKAELQDFAQNAGIIVSGHDNPNFRTLDGHLRITAGEAHPLVFEEGERLAYASELQGWLSPGSVVLQEVGKVITGFPDLFKKDFLQRGGTNVDEFAAYDRRLKSLAAKRNAKNHIKFREGEWGRNEVCDLIRLLPREDTLAQRLTDCAVAASQAIFAGSFPIETSVFLNSSHAREPKRSEDLAEKLEQDIKTSAPWEINLDLLGSRPWHEVSKFAAHDDWERPSNEFRAALVARDRARAVEALHNLVEVLRREYRPKNDGFRALVRPIFDKARDPTVGLAIAWIGSQVYRDTESYILGTQLSLVLADEAYARIQRHRRNKRLQLHLDYLYDWKSNLPRAY